MKEKDFRVSKIAIKDLFLWDENARFPDKYFKKSEKELIAYFISKKDLKTEELAEAIIKDFDLPQVEKIIVYEHEGRLIVLEGNRRLIVYKLLANSNLTDNIKLREFFQSLKSKIKIDDGLTLECLITNDKEQGLRYIDRKHVNGNNEVGWGDTERAHYSARRGNARKKEFFKIELTKIIKNLDIPEEMKEQVLGYGYVTTFYRILESSHAWKMFGFELDDNGVLFIKDRDFSEKLKVIITNVLKKEDFRGEKVNSRSLNKDGAVKEYLESIKKEDFDKVKEEISKNTQENIFGEKTIDITKKSNRSSYPKSLLRSYLIPHNCILKIKQAKINNIYKELKHDLIIDDSIKSVPNAVGVLFRVFLEISIDYFLEKEGITLKPDTKLAGKITGIADYMEKENIASTNQLKNIRKVATDKHNLLAIENFHDYVHSYKSQPSSNDLKLKWDNLQEFFEILWRHLENKTKPKTL